MKHWRLLLILAGLSSMAHADLYRWVDADGKVHYSDHPPPANVKQVEKKKLSGGQPTEPPLPYALQQAVNNFPVTMYVTDCGDTCTRARQLLAKRGIPYTEIDAAEPEAQNELRKLTGGQLEVPVLKVGDSTLRGFEEGRWNSSLDSAGYPQTAVIPPRPPTRPSKPGPASTPPASASPPAKATQ
jgi:glutaredoxin